MEFLLSLLAHSLGRDLFLFSESLFFSAFDAFASYALHVLQQQGLGHVHNTSRRYYRHVFSMITQFPSSQRLLHVGFIATSKTERIIQRPEALLPSNTLLIAYELSMTRQDILFLLGYLVKNGQDTNQITMLEKKKMALSALYNLQSFSPEPLWLFFRPQCSSLRYSLSM